MKYGFFRVCSASPCVTVAQCVENANSIIDCVHKASKNGASLVVFPELSITGYTCGDLFLQKSLQQSAIENLERIAQLTKNDNCIIAVGLPIAFNGALYNCAAIICCGKISGIIPKTFIPNYQEFYERRYFSPAPKNNDFLNISSTNKNIPFGTNLLFTIADNENFVLASEICEDMWVPLPPSTRHALAGATIIANLSASNEIIGKASYRRTLVSSQSARIVGAYVYSDAGHGESTQDVVFASHNLIAENGTILSESDLFSHDENDCSLIYADIDFERLMQDRIKTNTFAQCATMNDSSSYTKIELSLCKTENQDLNRFIDTHPFVPSNIEKRFERCSEVITLQAEGLAKRLRHINAKNAVIGLSGGLDSTLALLVTCRAFDLCKLDRSGIKAITMPCFGTTDRTYNNACILAKNTKSSLSEIKIADAVLQHFKDIGQDSKIHDVTYENSQARERTQILMDVANKCGGIVIGTGDLSEQALGWATYNGDHMSMYGVNGSIPKTLVRYLVEWFASEAENQKNTELAEVLRDILATPVSPELLPPENGNISQKTEELVGPYELHDFFIYYVLRFGFSPKKILFLAENAFKDLYSKEIILKWLKSFYRRFFSQQFKRSCMPDGAKVGTVNLSPRGDWRMPSDASAKIWLDELEDL